MIYVQSGRNVKIAVYDLNPTGSKQTILMIHGWPLSHKIYEYQEELLTQRGYRVVSLDLRGFGASDTPADGYSYDQLSDDIYNVVRFLELRDFILVGFSMGGGIVCRYMGRHNSYGVRKLVLLAAAAPSFTRRPDFPYGVTRASVDQLIQQARTDRPRMAAMFGGMLFNNVHSREVLEWFRDISWEASGIGTIQTAISLRDEDCRPDMKKIKVPTGIFHGKKDQIVPYELALVQQKEIAGAMLYPFDNSGHGIFYDELALFNQRFMEFVQK